MWFGRKLVQKKDTGKGCIHNKFGKDRSLDSEVKIVCK
jgi:hypothetical protein